MFKASFCFFVFWNICAFSIAEQEFLPNEENPEEDGKTATRHFVSDARTCAALSAMKESFFSSESATSLLQEFLSASKSKVDTLESILCDGSVRSKEKENQKISNSSVVDPSVSQKPTSCYDLKEILRFDANGIYTIWPSYFNRSVNVYCDMTTTNGGWTVIQRRTDLSGKQENFYRNWFDYKTGFGDLNGEFWIGNDAIFAMSNERQTTLRVDMEDFEGVKRYAYYTTFLVSSEVNKYQLKIEGYSGDAGDSFSYHSGKVFHTYDKTNHNCVEKFKGGWWYGDCHHCNLNGMYLRGNHQSYADGVNWKEFKGHHYSLKNVEMKIRPLIL